MDQAELMQKAFDTADLISGGGDLNPEQSEKFITYLQDLSVMTKDARVIPMKAKKRDINKIGIGARASVPAAEGTDPGVRKEPTVSKVTLDAVEIMTPFEITYDVFEDNIEGDNLEDSIIKLFATQIAMDHEELYIMADTAHPTDTFLQLFDGWRKVAKTSGHLYEHAAGAISAAVLSELYSLMPEKYLRNYADLRYYVSPKFEHGYKDILSQRSTAAGDRFTLEDVPATYNGIPVVRVPIIPSNLVETVGEVEYTDMTFVFLTLKQNLLVGIHRQMSLEKDKNIFARMRQYAFTSRIDCAFEEPDAVCIAEQISVGAAAS